MTVYLRRVEVYAQCLTHAVTIDTVSSLPIWRTTIWRDMVGPAMSLLYCGECDVKETLEQLRVQVEGETPEMGTLPLRLRAREQSDGGA